jgi:hypothetical protein
MAYTRTPNTVIAGTGLKQNPPPSPLAPAGAIPVVLDAEIATTTSLGVVQVGSGLAITLEGVLSTTGEGGQGIQGVQGTDGIQGARGITGSGTQGTTGNQGTQGRQGIQGIQGPQSQSVQGAQGLQGTKGSEDSSINVKLVNNDYTASLTDNYIGTAEKNITITLPAGVSGKLYYIKNQVSGNIKVECNEEDSIDGNSSKTLGTNGSCIIIFAGGRWNIL